MEEATENFVAVNVGCNLDPYSKGQFTTVKKRIQEVFRSFKVQCTLTALHSLTLLSLLMPESRLRSEFHFEYVDPSKPLGFIVDKIKLVGTTISCSLNSSEMALTMLGNSLMHAHGASGLQQFTNLALGSISKPITNQNDLSQICDNLARLAIGFRVFLRETYLEIKDQPQIPKIFFTNLGARFTFLPNSSRNKLNHLVSTRLDLGLTVPPQDQISGFLREVRGSEQLVLQTQRDMAHATLQLKHDRNNINSWLTYLRAATRTQFKVEPSVFDLLLVDGLNFFDQLYLGFLHLESKLDSSTLLTEQTQLKHVMRFFGPLVVELQSQGMAREALAVEVNLDVVAETKALGRPAGEQQGAAGGVLPTHRPDQHVRLTNPANEIRGAAPPAPAFPGLQAGTAVRQPPPGTLNTRFANIGASPDLKGTPGPRQRAPLNLDFNTLHSPQKAANQLPVFKTTANLDAITLADPVPSAPAPPAPAPAAAPIDTNPAVSAVSDVSAEQGEAAFRAFQSMMAQQPGMITDLLKKFENNSESQVIREAMNVALLQKQREVSEIEDSRRADELQEAMKHENLHAVNKYNADSGIQVAITSPHVNKTQSVRPPITSPTNSGPAAMEGEQTKAIVHSGGGLSFSIGGAGGGLARSPIQTNKTKVEFAESQQSGYSSAGGENSEAVSDGYDSIHSHATH